MQTERSERETYLISFHHNTTNEKYVTGKVFDDALSFSYDPIDLHDKHGVIPEHLEEGVVATIPLRAPIPKKSRNFIVAGRCPSSDQLANIALRVQSSCMGMGKAAASDAPLSNTKATTHLEVPLEALPQIIESQGGIF